MTTKKTVRYKIKLFQKDEETGEEDTIESVMEDDFLMANHVLESLQEGLEEMNKKQVVNKTEYTWGFYPKK